MIKPIETRYAGCRFRSRLEARVAVLLDELGVAWEYEPQGFATDAGPYLPDFLAALDGGGACWIEVKGKDAPTEREFAVAREVEAGTGSRLVFLCGDLPRECTEDGGEGCLPALRTDGSPTLLCFDGADAARMDAALSTARSARFEHGEHGR
jgi:hypothetical protein